MGIRLIKPWEAREYREDTERLASGCAGMGRVSEEVATGRATCRACGRKIAKGEKCLEALYDFTNGNGTAGDPFTGVWIKLHDFDCLVDREDGGKL